MDIVQNIKIKQDYKFLVKQMFNDPNTEFKMIEYFLWGILHNIEL